MAKYLGAHVGIGGGLHNAPGNAKALDCTAFAMFCKSQRQWRAPPIPAAAAADFQRAMQENGYAPEQVVVHDAYLINMGSSDRDTREKSTIAFKVEVERCGLLGLSLICFHPGSHLGDGETTGMERIAESVARVLDETKGSRVRVLFENAAGQGSNVGYRFGELATMLDAVGDKRRTGVCFDTCHAFAAGYDLSTAKGYDAVFAEFDDVVGFDRLFAFHLNDSAKGLGSRLDRHAMIGQGLLGKEAFRLLVNDPRFDEIPMVLETSDNDDDYRTDLKTLRSLIKGG
ncbi:MAG: deoxyribonuclease IV [Methanobacteriota archaeon]